MRQRAAGEYSAVPVGPAGAKNPAQVAKKKKYHPIIEFFLDEEVIAVVVVTGIALSIIGVGVCVVLYSVGFFHIIYH